MPMPDYPDVTVEDPDDDEGTPQGEVDLSDEHLAELKKAGERT